MKFCTVRDLRINASKVIRQARRHRVVVTVRGRPMAAIVPIDEDDFEGLNIDLYPELRKSLEEGEKAFARGEGISLAALKRRLKSRV